MMELWNFGTLPRLSASYKDEVVAGGLMLMLVDLVFIDCLNVVSFIHPSFINLVTTFLILDILWFHLFLGFLFHFLLMCILFSVWSLIINL